jgi:hypothetical protein
MKEMKTTIEDERMRNFIMSTKWNVINKLLNEFIFFRFPHRIQNKKKHLNEVLKVLKTNFKTLSDKTLNIFIQYRSSFHGVGKASMKNSYFKELFL